MGGFVWLGMGSLTVLSSSDSAAAVARLVVVSWNKWSTTPEAAVHPWWSVPPAKCGGVVLFRWRHSTVRSPARLLIGGCVSCWPMGVRAEGVSGVAARVRKPSTFPVANFVIISDRRRRGTQRRPGGGATAVSYLNLVATGEGCLPAALSSQQTPTLHALLKTDRRILALTVLSVVSQWL